MAQEQIQESYYSAVGNKWIDIHQSVKTCIEVWLSKLLFQGDLSSNSMRLRKVISGTL
jgi:hypothetical protein